MKIDLDSHELTLTCPGCGKKFDEKIGRLKNNPTIPCPGCGKSINIHADELSSGIETIQKSLDNLTRTLSNFGK